VDFIERKKRCRTPRGKSNGFASAPFVLWRVGHPFNRMNPFSSQRPVVELLEQRIAPALLINGANLLGAGNPTTGETSIAGNSVTLVKVLSGEAIVWFDHGTIDAISVGPNTSLDITGNVTTIVGNLTASGKLSDSDGNPANGLDGDVLLPNNITGITTHPLGSELGSITDIITGGSISNLNISGNLTGVFAGTGAFYPGTGAHPADKVVIPVSAVLQNSAVVVYTGSIDVNPVLPGVQSSFTFAASNAKTVESGASITNVKMGAAEELQMYAGDGFNGSPAINGHPATAGLPGGSITGVTLSNAFVDSTLPSGTPSYVFLAGAGGAGIKGGAGGSIQKIQELNSSGVAIIHAGHGGAGTGGAGGAGGSVKSLDMQSDSTAYTVEAGAGGVGAPGGAGGSVTGVNFGGNQLSNGVIVAAPFTGGSADDVLLIDGQTGTMIIEQNNLNIPGSTTAGFTPVIQDSQTLQTTIGPVGEGAIGAVAVDVNNDGLPDIVVAYKDTTNLGVYINQGGGVFYQENFSNGNYTGDTLEATAIGLPAAPTQIASGNFIGDFSQDIGVLLDNAGQTQFMALMGDGKGGFAVPTTGINLPANPVSLIPGFVASDGYTSLFVGIKTGEIDALLPSGSGSSVTYTDKNTGTIVGNGIANIDYNPWEGMLVALDATGDTLSFYTASGAGLLSPLVNVSLAQEPGTGLMVHFVPNGSNQSPVEPLDLLSSVGSGSRLDVYSQVGSTFTLTSSVLSTESLKIFVPVLESGTSGVAALGTSSDHFSFSDNGGNFADIGLPFTGKTVVIGAGKGGDGLTTVTAAGGAGGMVSGMSILAGQIVVTAGDGGVGNNAGGGAGGVVIDTPTLTTFTGQTVQTILQADTKLNIAAGEGGVADGTAHTAFGGAGGKVQGLNLSMLTGDININSGDGGNGGGGAGGSGGIITAIKSLDQGGSLDVVAGAGGSALGATGNGGAGGSIVNLTHSLTLEDQSVEAGYDVTLITGPGGNSVVGIGGAGGSISNINLTLQAPFESVNNPQATPPTSHVDINSTMVVTVETGNGGNGATGGAGGSIKTISSAAVFNQYITIVGSTPSQTYSFWEVNPVAGVFTTGAGGAGTKGVGGAGGSIGALTLQGFSYYDLDPSDTMVGQTPLVITSGNGGNGSTIGGAGGSIVGVVSENAQAYLPGTTTKMNLTQTQLSGATITSGRGGNGASGNGGAGGTISNLSVAVSGIHMATSEVLLPSASVIYSLSQLTVQTGAGGAGGATGKGGAGGSISNSLLGVVDAFNEYGLLLQGGAGGGGGMGGGTGGNITNIQLNVTQNASQDPSYLSGYDVLSTIILAGDGGAATSASGIGGTGGSISQIVQQKDVNSPINVLQAGNGGAAVKTGGLGGSVTGVNTVGLIGQASDGYGNSFGAFETYVQPGVFDSLFPGGVPEGVFAGRGGAGATNGAPGSVTSITAAQIAAIGAAVDSNGLFAAAAKIANITAEYIAYDVNGNGLYDNATGTNRTAPDQAVPIDGFIFSLTAPTGINTASKNLAAFTFTP
jgi:hypothetical protein